MRNKPLTVTDEQIIEACNSSLSMSEANSKVDLHSRTFKKRAMVLGVYKTNVPGKGITKKGVELFPLDEILAGKHPHFQTNKLRKKILKKGIKPHKCEKCELTVWNNKPIPLELNHIDGNRTNHVLSNIELICPNCHAQTATYRGKNVKRFKLTSPDGEIR
jgi:hypothetical protein